MEKGKPRRSLALRLFPWIIVFGLGGGAGYYLRDAQESRDLERAVEEARREAAEAGLDAIERAKRAGEGLGAGFEAAADSARAALRDLLSPRDP